MSPEPAPPSPAPLQAAAPASPPRRWYHWIFPRQGTRKLALFRVTLIVFLMLIFRQHVVAWVSLGHDYVWRKLTGQTQHCPEDIRRLTQCGLPGARMLERIGCEAAWAETDFQLTPTLTLLLENHSLLPSTRAAALDGLCRFWDESTSPLLEKALSDPSRELRTAAARNILVLRFDHLLPQLKKALETEGDSLARLTLQQTIQGLSALPPPGAPEGAALVKVAAIQFRSELGQAEQNRKRLEEYIRQAAQNGAKIVVLPETAITGYTSEDFRRVWQLEGWKIDGRFSGVDPRAHAEAVDGESVTAFSRLADELQIYLTIPFLEVDGQSNRYFNTIVLTGPDGAVRAHYRKINPWPEAESGWASPGDRGLQVIDTEYGRLGLLVCYDINFEPPRLKQLKLDTLLYCIAWVDKEKSRWFHVDLPGIAKANNFNLIGANWTISKHYDWHGYGQSLIVDRHGQTLARAAQDIGEEIIYAELAVPKAESCCPGEH